LSQRRSRSLYVGSLNFALTSDDIREVFQPFGELETVELHRDAATGKSKGYCFVKCVFFSLSFLCSFPFPRQLLLSLLPVLTLTVNIGSRSTTTP
jgi:hypothetical protein